MSDHDRLRGLLPGYALGCLDPGEMREVRAHLAGCRECRGSCRELEDTTGELAAALPPVPPPAALEERVVRRLRRLRARRAGITLGTGWAAAAAVLVLLLAGGNAWQLARAARAPASTPASTGTPLTTIVLRGVSEGSGVYGTVVLDPVDFEGVMAIRGLPVLDAAHQYQLWLIRGTERRSGGVFSVNEGGYGNLLIAVPEDFTDFGALGVSVEPAGGSPSPTGARVAAGAL